jgi:hypothetical protein
MQKHEHDVSIVIAWTCRSFGQEYLLKTSVYNRTCINKICSIIAPISYSFAFVGSHAKRAQSLVYSLIARYLNTCVNKHYNPMPQGRKSLEFGLGVNVLSFKKFLHQNSCLNNGPF